MQALSALVSVLISFSAFAGDVKPYSAAAFKAAQASGRPFGLVFHSDWCPACQRQKRVMDHLIHDKDFEGLVVLSADWEKEKDLLKKHGATLRTTLIMFKGEKEIGRGVGREAIRPPLLRALLLRK